MNFSLQFKGVTYLKDAVAYIFLQPDNTNVSLSGEVYPYIANKRKVKEHNIERNIRNAIQSCYYNGNMHVLNELCGYNIILDQYPPTVSEFTSKIVEVIKVINQTYREKSQL